MTVRELFDLTGENLDSFLEEVRDMNLGYGNFAGTPRLRLAVSNLYQDVSPEDVVLVHGGTGANNTVVMTLLEPGDSIVAVMPNYQQFYSIPRSIGVDVRPGRPAGGGRLQAGHGPAAPGRERELRRWPSAEGREGDPVHQSQQSDRFPPGAF